MSVDKRVWLALLATAVVGGLVWTGVQRAQNIKHQDPAASTDSNSQAPAEKKTEPVQEPQPLVSLQHETRQLIPQNAWLVADLRGDLTGEKPFGDQEGLCKDVPAPSRVAVALLPPPAGSSEGPALMLAAPAVEDVFWGCVRDRIVRAGGNALAENAQFEILQSPSGIVARGPHGALMYLSSQAQLESALASLSNLSPSTAASGIHAQLFRLMHPPGQKSEAELDLTLSLPEGWLSNFGDDANLTPLRHMKSAYLSLDESGGASGALNCLEPGCQELYDFLVRAKKDMTSRLPPVQGSVVSSALGFSYEKGSAQVSVTWSAAAGRFQDLLSGLLGNRAGLLGP